MSEPPIQRPAWSRIERELLASGFRPSRRLGQNFLREPRVLAAAVAAAELAPGARVLEVGAGYGSLSFELAAAGAELVALEIDPRLAELARRSLAPFSNARVVVADALASKHALAQELLAAIAGWRDWTLVANLPYSIASPLVALLARLPEPPQRIVATVQREVAERLLARTGTGDFGPLSVRVQLAYAGTLVRRVPPSAFSPAPEVESAIVRLERRADRPEPEDWPALDRLVDVPFRQRRKALLGPLRAELGSADLATALLAGAGVAPELRPERLAPEVWLRLSRGALWRRHAAAGPSRAAAGGRARRRGG